MRVKLWGICSLMLIIPEKTGVTYENQTWGTTCFQDSLEGILIPISNDYLPKNYEDSLDYQITSLFPDGSSGYIDENLAKTIQNILTKYHESKGIKINWDKLKNSHEAWLHVIVNDSESDLYSGLKNIEAVLTWNNSD
ncbi:MAG: hypothetical protein HQM12_03845 [SAR324 cluster bacterium]|nr:hypothetical protein [SAR324 cluster bacterium]